MKKFFLIFALVLSLVALVSCDSEIKEPVTPSAPVEEEKEDIKVSVSIALVSSLTGARTVLPESSSLLEANYYEVALVDTNSLESRYNSSATVTSGAGANVSFDSVKVGEYEVYAKAYLKGENETPVLLYEGKADNNLKVSVGGTNTAIVTLKAVNSGSGLTGSVNVTIDWSEASQVDGVVKDVATKNELKVKFFYTDDYSANNYNPTYRILEEKTVAVGVTSVTFNTGNIPVTKNGMGYFGIYYTVDGIEYLLLRLSHDSYQIYSGQVSVPDSPDLYIVSDKNNPVEINEMKMTLSYGEDPVKDLKVTWTNSDEDGHFLYENISLVLYETDGTSRREVERKVFSLLEVRANDMEYQFDYDLVRGKSYIVKAVGRTPYGRETKPFVSNLFQPKVLAESIAIDESNMPLEYIGTGASFTLSASVSPLDTTYKALEWSASGLFDIVDNDGLYNTVTLTAIKPGMTTITATVKDGDSVDENGEIISSTTERSVKVRLRKPETPSKEIVGIDGGESIRITWPNSDVWASGYEVYRIVDGVMESTPVALVEGGSNEYTDTNIYTSTSYSYCVKAVNESLKTEAFDPSSELSSSTEAVTPVVPTITFIQPTIENFKLSISGGSGNASDIMVTPSSPQTVSIPSAIDGIVKYTWLVNGKLIRSGNFQVAQSITLTAEMDSVQIVGGDANVLTLIGETADGTAYSTSTYFRVVTVATESAVIGNSISSISVKAEPYQLDAYVLPLNATMQNVSFSSSDESIVTVSPTGLLTVKKSGEVTIKAIPVAGEPAEMHLTVFNPLQSEEVLVRVINDALRSRLQAANSTFKNDWWPGLYDPDTATMDNGAVVVKSSCRTDQKFGSLAINGLTLSNVSYGGVSYGTFTLSTSSTISLEAEKYSGFGVGYTGNNVLKIISRDNSGNLKVDLPYGQGTATINIRSINVNDGSGSYTVTLPGKSGVTINYSSVKDGNPIY